MSNTTQPSEEGTVTISTDLGELDVQTPWGEYYLDASIGVGLTIPIVTIVEPEGRFEVTVEPFNGNSHPDMDEHFTVFVREFTTYVDEYDEYIDPYERHQESFDSPQDALKKASELAFEINKGEF